MVSEASKTHLLLYEISTEDILKIRSKNHQITVFTYQIQQLCKYEHTEVPAEPTSEQKKRSFRDTNLTFSSQLWVTEPVRLLTSPGATQEYSTPPQHTHYQPLPR